MSRPTQDTNYQWYGCGYGPFTPCGTAFQPASPSHVHKISSVLQPRARLNVPGLGYSHFDRHYSGNHYCFLFLRLIRCFSSPGLLPSRDGGPSDHRVAPFGNPRIYRIFAPPRGLSQLVTSFIASESLGIHHAPLFTFSSFLSY